VKPQLLKTFKDIPEETTGDLFGQIYEYFLGEFARSEGSKGGEFFTPRSVVNLFATSLKPKGRAALVMANSASDARHSEADIRRTLIEKNLIAAMLTLPSNMFYTVTLPATLWFFDKAKTDDRILFIDARNIFTQIDRAHREFSDEQIQNIAIISQLHKGRREKFVQLVDRYFAAAMERLIENKIRIEPIVLLVHRLFASVFLAVLFVAGLEFVEAGPLLHKFTHRLFPGFIVQHFEQLRGNPPRSPSNLSSVRPPQQEWTMHTLCSAKSSQSSGVSVVFPTSTVVKLLSLHWPCPRTTPAPSSPALFWSTVLW
jgi:hypothetical protein